MTNSSKLAIASLLTLAAGADAQSRTNDAAVLLQAATHQETVAGNLDSAIALYRSVAGDKRADRATTAKALVSMGRAYETLGSKEAQRAYERVVREFGDQSAQADVARTRLATLSRKPTSTGTVARRLWSGRGVDLMGRPSPDGRELSFTDWTTGELAVRDLATGAQRNLTRSGGWETTEDYAEVSAWSRDGKQIAFTWYNQDDDYELRVVRPDGTGERRVHINPEDVYFWVDDWSPDGKQLLLNVSRRDKSNQMALVSVADGKKTVLKTFDWRWPLEMEFSPDGKWIAYDFPPAEESNERDIYVIAVDGSRETTVIKHAADDRLMGWAPDGLGILFTTNRRGVVDLAFQPIRGGETQGEMQVVRAEVGAIESIGMRGDSFFYGSRTGFSDLYIGEIDLTSGPNGRITGKPVKLPSRVEGRASQPVWSPDGATIAYIAGPSAAGASSMLAIRTAASGEERRLPVQNFLRIFQLEWSPDQKAIYILGNNRKEGQGIYRVDLETGVQTSMLIPDMSVRAIARHQEYQMFAVTPDGKELLYSLGGNGKTLPSQLLAYDIAAGTSRVIHEIAIAPHLEGLWYYGVVVSPDGKQLAFELADADPMTSVGIFTVPLAGGEARELARHKQFAAPVAWTPDGKEVLYEVDRPGPSTTGRPHTHHLWRVAASGGTARQVDQGEEWLVKTRMHRDGKRFVIAKGAVSSELWVLENVIPKPATAPRR